MQVGASPAFASKVFVDRLTLRFLKPIVALSPGELHIASIAAFARCIPNPRTPGVGSFHAEMHELASLVTNLPTPLRQTLVESLSSILPKPLCFSRTCSSSTIKTKRQLVRRAVGGAECGRGGSCLPLARQHLNVTVHYQIRV